MARTLRDIAFTMTMVCIYGLGYVLAQGLMLYDRLGRMWKRK